MQKTSKREGFSFQKGETASINEDACSFLATEEKPIAGNYHFCTESMYEKERIIALKLLIKGRCRRIFYNWK